MEGSKRGVFFNIGTFKNILKSITLPQKHKNEVSSLAKRMAQFKDRKKSDLTYGTNTNGTPENTTQPVRPIPIIKPDSQARAVFVKNEHLTIPPPPVIIEGTPPLTVRAVAAWRTLIEWTARTRLTATQEKELQLILINHYQKGGNSRKTVLSFVDTLSPYHLYSLEASRAKKLREQLSEKFKSMSKTSNKAIDDWSLFERIFYGREAIIVKGELPLTLQARDGAIEMLFFIETLISNGAGAKIEHKQNTMIKSIFHPIFATNGINLQKLKEKHLVTFSFNGLKSDYYG